ncbi:hypothetical protein LIER_43420 [Lithospermum erythrorhizon]|uniref:Uncharacterized protein n=1 Tax=Lithospermum erythrorhizon TaxID=34254 RepID=A0AAV3Q1B7_LITER
MKHQATSPSHIHMLQNDMINLLLIHLTLEMENAELCYIMQGLSLSKEKTGLRRNFKRGWVLKAYTVMCGRTGDHHRTTSLRKIHHLGQHGLW